MLSVRVLGTFEVTYGENPVQISGRLAQSLFAYLIVNSDVPHRREKLSALFWPDTPETTARDKLRNSLWRIRKALAAASPLDYLETNDFVIQFNTDAKHWLDASALRNANKCQSADALISVLSVYQGELLPGFYEEWVELEREYLNYVFEHNMARLMAILQGERRWLDILDWGERWLAFGQKPEPAYRALMLAHNEVGEMSAVAETFSRCIRAYEEIGLEPSGQTRRLYERLTKGKVNTA